MIEAYLSFNGVAAILFALLCFCFVLARAILNQALSFLDWSILFMGLIYGISSPFVVSYIVNDPRPYVGSEFLITRQGDYGLQLVAATLGLMGLLTGWGIASGFGRWHRGRRPSTQDRVGLLGGANNVKVFAGAFWAMLGVAFVAQFLYAIDYGGLGGVIEYSRRIRSAVFTFERSRFSFLRPVAGFALLACYGFLGLLLGRKEGPRRWVASGFLVSLGFSLYVLYTWQGRLGAATFLAIILLAILLRYQSKPVLLVLGFAAAAFGGMLVVYGLAEIFDLKSSESFSQFYVKELAFIFTGFWAEVAHPENGMRMFYDIAIAPLFLVPSSWVGGWVETVTSVHTASMLGAPKGTAGVTGGMPLDILTMGYMQMGVLGVFLYAAMFGALLRWLQGVAKSIGPEGLRASFTAYVALRIAGFGLFYAQPEHILEGNYPLVVTLILLQIRRWFLNAEKGRDIASRSSRGRSSAGGG